MNQIELKLKKWLQSGIKEGFAIDLDLDEIVIEIPKEKEHGDYSSNVAMRLSKQCKKSPRDVASQLIEILSPQSDLVDRCEIAGPGFINFFLDSKSISGVIATVLQQQECYGASHTGQGIKVNLEYVSANPTGDLHPGHARGAAIGDSVARLLKLSGYEVCREYYVNDAGNQMMNLALSTQARYFEHFGLSFEIPEDGYYGSDIIEIAKDFAEEYGDKYLNINKEESLSVFKAYAYKKELNKLKEDLKSFNVEFDVWSSETAIYDRGLVKKALNTLIEQGVTYHEEGALWLNTTQFGDDKDRVLQKSDGSYTYLMPDIAYHLDKLDRKFDKLVDFFGADHHGYIQRLKAAIQALGHSSDKLDVDIIQMVRMIKDGEEFKMSKRSGKAVALRDLLDEAGVDAVRYYFASRATDTQMDFDLNMAVKQSNENPVYYAQYAHARMCSILRLAENDGFEVSTETDLIKDPKELALCKHINEFTGIVSEAAKNRQPHRMCNYIRTLAQYFHSFYTDCRVVDKENPTLSSQRLALVTATKITLKNALNCIGVSAPEKM